MSTTILLKSFLPEIFFSLCILLQLIFNIRLINNLNFNFPLIEREVFIQSGFFFFCLILLYLNIKIEGVFPNFIFINDGGALTVKIFISFICLTTLLLMYRSFLIQKLNYFEFIILYLFSALSLLLLASCTDLIAFYLLIELQSLSFYVLTAFKRDSSFCAEAGLKYFIVGSLMSGAFLMGTSLIYGSLGTTNLNALFVLLMSGTNETFLMFNFFDFKMIYRVGIFLVTFTILFKIACAPFHFWVPDVYEGAPLSSTILFSIVPKIGMVYFLIRWSNCICCVSSSAESDFKSVLLFCGVFSCFIGVFFAFSQKRIKRLLIYSTIGQVGFLVSAISLNTLLGYVSSLFFLFVYVITSIIIWGHISFFIRFKNDVASFFNRDQSPLFITDIADIVNKNYLWGFSLVLVFFSIAGIPPLVGFSAKIFVLLEIAKTSLLSVTILLILSSISAYYYIRIIKLSFFEHSLKNSEQKKNSIITFSTDLDLFLVCVLIFFFFLIGGFFFPEFALLLCERTLLMTLGV